MKRKLTAIGLIILLTLTFCVGAAAQSMWGTYKGYDIVKVKVDGTEVTGDVPAIIFNGRTMVPVRFVAEALGATVNWDQNTQTVLIYREGSPAVAPVLIPKTTSTTPTTKSPLAKYVQSKYGKLTYNTWLSQSQANYEQSISFTVTEFYSEPMDCTIVELTFGDIDYLDWLGEEDIKGKWAKEMGEDILRQLGGNVNLMVAVHFVATYLTEPWFEPDAQTKGADGKWHVNRVMMTAQNLVDGTIQVTFR